MNSTDILMSSCRTFLCWIQAGVLQGCPFSGSIFAIALDPILAFMEKRLRRGSLGIVRACADDIGAALSSIKGFSVLQPIFQLARVSAGLRLKPSKCVVIQYSVNFLRVPNEPS